MIDLDHRYKLSVEDSHLEADFLDFSSTTIRTAGPNFSSEYFTRSLSSAPGIVLLYDITSKESFEYITNQAYMYLWMCRRYLHGGVGAKHCDMVLVGNKTDIVLGEPDKRQVDKDLAEEWAQSQGMKHFEVTTYDRQQLEEVARTLMVAIEKTKRRIEKRKTSRPGQSSLTHLLKRITLSKSTPKQPPASSQT